MILKSSLFGTDENGNEVFMAKGDSVSEISDGGAGGFGPFAQGWNVIVRLTPSHKQWTELVTVDAVKLLKALED